MHKAVMFPEKDDLELHDISDINEEDGSLATQTEEDKLLHSVLENDEKIIADGKLVLEALNQGTSTFMPDLMFENITQQYSLAEQLYGERIIQLMTGYSAGYVKKNIHIPEFAKALQAAIGKKAEELKKNGLLDSENEITDSAVYLASLILYTTELDRLSSLSDQGIPHKKSMQGNDSVVGLRNYRKFDKYKSINVRQTIKQAIRRNHSSYVPSDLIVSEYRSKKRLEVIYGIDASGSMRGKKIAAAKRAGVALAYHAVNRGDSVGLVVFGSQVKDSLHPTKDFKQILERLVLARAASETNIAKTINHAVQIFSSKKCSKHIILLTDAVPTSGNNPSVESIRAAAEAASSNIAVSIIGIGLDAEGEKLARKIVTAGNGRLYSINNIEDLDCVILQEYDIASRA